MLCPVQRLRVELVTTTVGKAARAAPLHPGGVIELKIGDWSLSDGAEQHPLWVETDFAVPVPRPPERRQ